MPDFFTVSDTVLAAMIAALTTLVTAFLNLRSSWKKELKERERGQAITKKSRRGMVIAVLFLMVGSGVGGFAFSQYLMEQDDLRLRSANAETHATLQKILAATERLERATGTGAAPSAVSCRPASVPGEGTAREQAAPSAGASLPKPG
jgi:NADH:ubiquinone oxidoreductase subunit 5 (subunit L)/multisubunit Na+/H+ antiporter MnhA subunit